MLNINCRDLQFFSYGISHSPVTLGQDDITLIHSELQQCPRARGETVRNFSRSKSVPQLTFHRFH